MNIIDKKVMNLLLLPSKLYEKLDVNMHQLRCILLTKLEIDDRTPSPLAKIRRRTNANKQTKNISWVGIFQSGIMGFMLAFVLIAFSHRITSLTLYFSSILFMMTMLVVSGLSNILLDSKDNFIILPKPIGAQTVAVSRVLHILVRLFNIAIPLLLPGLIVVFFRYGIGVGLATILMQLLSVFFVVFIVNCIYLILLRFISPQRFLSALSMVQILLAVVIYVGFQLVPRLLGEDSGSVHFDITQYRSSIFFPFYWFGAGADALGHLDGSAFAWLGFGLAIVVPLFSMFFMIKYLAPVFNRRIVEINNGGEALATVSSSRKKEKSIKKDQLARLLTNSPLEKSGFQLVWNMTARNKDFKLKVYPFFAYIIVYVIILPMMSKKHVSLAELQLGAPTGKLLLLGMMYSCAMMLFAAITQIAYTPNYKAAWVYFTSPISKPGEIVVGGLKAVLAKFLIVPMVVVAIAAVSIMGWRVMPNLILGFSNTILLSLLMVCINRQSYLPFSVSENNQEKGLDVLRSFLRIFLIFVLGGLHYILFNYIWVVSIVALLSIVAVWYITIFIKNFDWNRIRLFSVE